MLSCTCRCDVYCGTVVCSVCSVCCCGLLLLLWFVDVVYCRGLMLWFAVVSLCCMLQSVYCCDLLLRFAVVVCCCGLFAVAV